MAAMEEVRAEPFLSLVLDDELVRTEFDAMVALEWPETVLSGRQAGTEAGCGPSDSPFDQADRNVGAVLSAERSERHKLGGRQRSPPDGVTEFPVSDVQKGAV